VRTATAREEEEDREAPVSNAGMNRWKPALNAFAITFEGRIF
jgi:hypothetical protein